MSTRRDRLGKGLGALLGDYLAPPPEGEVRRLRLESIVPNPMQPRQEFSEKELDELASSIRENGLLQPLLVRPARGTAGRYELVAGERRFRAVRLLGWEEAAAVVREVEDEAMLILALVENLQREALNPLEEAEGYKSLVDRFGMTQEEISRAVGRERSTVSNIMRLLKLPPSIRKLLQGGRLSMGHARALLTVEDPVLAADLARRAADEGWPVREVERRAASQKGKGPPRERQETQRDPAVIALEEALRAHLSTRVQVRGLAKGKGTIEIPFDSDEEFERLFALIARREASEVIG
jgi:ParB family chromosome partitioning protein